MSFTKSLLASFQKSALICEVRSLIPSNFQSSAPINQTFEKVLSTYKFRFIRLYTDEFAIRIEYKCTPPIPSPEEISAMLPYATFWGYAVDNLGNEYQSVGGAFGLSADKESTQGVLSFTPLPDKVATSIKFTLELEQDVDERIEFSVRICDVSST
ncbi:hypothetical protein [Vasconcelosia minhoensis]|nr:hypothetical protein [Romeria gracilis]